MTTLTTYSLFKAWLIWRLLDLGIGIAGCLIIGIVTGVTMLIIQNPKRKGKK